MIGLKNKLLKKMKTHELFLLGHIILKATSNKIFFNKNLQRDMHLKSLSEYM